MTGISPIQQHTLLYTGTREDKNNFSKILGNTYYYIIVIGKTVFSPINFLIEKGLSLQVL